MRVWLRSSLRGVGVASLILGTGLVACTSAPTPEGVGSQESAATSESAYSSATWVDGSVKSFKAVDATEVYVLGTDGKLWDEWGTMASRTLVYTGVADYQVVGGVPYVLDTAGNLWRNPFGTWIWVDANVASFQALDWQMVYVKGTDNKLWLETGNYTSRTFVDANVATFQGLDTTTVFVLGSDGKLWHEVGSYLARTMVDANVASFQATSTEDIFVEGTDGNLWNERGDYTQRMPVDGNVFKFQSFDTQTIFVEGTDGKLWRELYSNQHRDFVDQGLTAFQAVGDDTIYVLHSDGTLLREDLSAPMCTFNYPNTSSCGLFPYIQAWAVQGACQGNIRGAGGTWSPIQAPDAGVGNGNEGSNGVPHDWARNVPSCSTAFPGQSCCTYVWWPDSDALQDPSALCTGSGTNATALVYCGNFCWHRHCHHGGTGGCDTCDSGGGF
jgi:hypothetical protein